jgi:hypothetical protein
LTEEQKIAALGLASNYMGKEWIQRKLGWMDDEMDLLDHDDVLFDCDWGWLMPLVLKMINTQSSSLCMDGDGYYDYGKFHFNIFPDQVNSQSAFAPIGEEINAVWEAVSLALQTTKPPEK